MKILIITDAWHPQVNGVVRTLEEVGKQLVLLGHSVTYLTPQDFKHVPVPTYNEIKLSLNVWKVGGMIRAGNYDAIHIATEGSLGFAARIWCGWYNVPFTSSYHTKMPEYVNVRFPFIPESPIYALLRWLHRPSKAVLVTTPSMKAELDQRGFDNLVVWSRGVDLELFHPNYRYPTLSLPKTRTLLYVGRVSVEKNLEAFLTLDIPNTSKVVVGDGPARKELEAKYPNAEFVGYKKGQELARYMANADVFVFPSKTDTFGIVMIEAAACGTPVAAFPVTGPIDFVVNGVNGFVDDNLETAVEKCLRLDRALVADHTKLNYSWNKCAKVLLAQMMRS